MDLEGFILTGGQSTRMGARKDLITLGGISLVKRAAASLSISAGSVSIVGNAPPEDVELRVILDDPWLIDGVPVEGPLRGLRTACLASSSTWIAVLACDLPFATHQVFQLLLEQLNISTAAGKEPDAVVPIQPDARPQPLCALYRREAVLAAINGSVETTDLSLRALLSRLDVQYIAFHIFKDLPNSEHLFLNINTPADHERAIDVLTTDH